MNAMKGYLGNPDQTKTHANPRAHKNRKCVTCIHESFISFHPESRFQTKRCVSQSFLIISLSTFGSQKKKSHGQSGEAERIFQQTPPREESLPPQKPQAFLPKDKNIIAVCQGISFMTIHSWYHLSIGRGIVVSLSIYKSAAVRLSLCSLCSFDRYFVMFFLSLICC